MNPDNGSLRMLEPQVAKFVEPGLPTAPAVSARIEELDAEMQALLEREPREVVTLDPRVQEAEAELRRRREELTQAVATREVAVGAGAAQKIGLGERELERRKRRRAQAKKSRRANR